MYDPGPGHSERAAVLGATAARLQRAHRVDLSRGLSVTSLEGDAAGHVCKAHLDDGTTLDFDRFDDPERFDPEREDNEHLALLSGIRYCFGAGLARQQAQVALTEPVRRMEYPRLVEDPPPYPPNPVLRGPRHQRIEVDEVNSA